MITENKNKLSFLLSRIVITLAVYIGVWRFIAYLNLAFNAPYSPLNHFILATLTSILTIVTMQFILKFDRLKWRFLIHIAMKKNLLSFLLGLAIFIFPASIGLMISITLGTVEIHFMSNIIELLKSFLLLFTTVFLIEAFPEEIIFRGYFYRLLNRRFTHGVTIILQAILFTIFAYFIGALYSVDQVMFIPGFAIILGLFRAISGSVWTSIGFHVALMSVTQILSPIHGHFDVEGMMNLQFFAFILLPSVFGATILPLLFTSFSWSKVHPDQ